MQSVRARDRKTIPFLGLASCYARDAYIPCFHNAYCELTVMLTECLLSAYCELTVKCTDQDYTLGIVRVPLDCHSATPICPGQPHDYTPLWALNFRHKCCNSTRTGFWIPNTLDCTRDVLSQSVLLRTLDDPLS